MFRKAERKQSRLRLALCGPSGSGKTHGALLIAKGLGGKVALCDTENGSGDLYAHLFDYDVAPIVDSFEPEKYISVIRGAEKAGYSVLIIDSLSHAWSGEGGILDMVDMAAKSSKSNNSYTAWRNVTPKHNELVDAILQSKMHVIVTMRTKTAYDLQKDEHGKTKPVKIGLAPVQRDGMEYEFTVVLDLSVEGHVATSSKDRTQLFDGKNFVIDEDTGKKLLAWLNEGTSTKEVEERTNKTLQDQLDLLKTARTMEELKLYFVAAKSKFAGNRDALTQIEAVKNDIKKELDPRQERAA